MKPKVLNNPRNDFYIPEERYYELVHFCRQYKSWQRALDCIDSMSQIPQTTMERVQSSDIPDPTTTAAEAREYYIHRINMIEESANRTTHPDIAKYIIQVVTDPDKSYDNISAKEVIPCGRNTFYRLYRKFFWHLSALRE